MKDLSIVYMGTPEFAVAPLKRLVEEGYNIKAVVTVPDKPAGRGLKFTESAVKEYAKSVKIPLMQPVLLKDPEFISSLEAIKADVFIVVAFRMLPKIVWSMPRLGTFNLHASLLPQYRGAAPINWAIINGEKKSGVTTFMIDEKIDTGVILKQRECDIDAHENVGTLYEKLMNMGAELLLQTVDALASNTLTPIEQSDTENLKQAPKLTKEICKIKWDSRAKEIEQLILGLSPYPAAFGTITNGERTTDIKIYDAIIESESANIATGSIISDGKTFLKVKCSDNFLSIITLQASGKRKMSIKDFLSGFRNIEQYKFT